MRILHFYAGSLTEVGGAEVFIMALAKEQARLGHTTAAMEISHQTWPVCRVFDGMPLWSIDKPVFPSLGRLRSWIWLINAVREFQFVCRRFRPDIVHVHFPLWQCLHVIGGGFIPHSWRSVTTLHGSDIRSVPHSNLRWRPWQARLLRHTDAVTSVSQGLLRDALDLYPRTCQRTLVIYSGVGSEWFASSEGLEAPRVRYILFVGRLHPVKGVDILLKAWSKVHRDLPSTQLWLAGEGPEREALMALANELGLGSGVTFLGNRPPSELKALYSGAACVVLPSRQEGLALVLLEAGACGSIRVGSRIPGVTEVISDGETGFLADPGSPDALASTILRAVNMPGVERQRIGEASREQTRKRFTQEAAASQYIALYQTVLQPNKRAAVQVKARA